MSLIARVPEVTTEQLQKPLEHIEIEIPSATWYRFAAAYQIPSEVISAIDTELHQYADAVYSRKPKLHADLLDRSYAALVDAVVSGEECVGRPCSLAEALYSKFEGLNSGLQEPDRLKITDGKHVEYFIGHIAHVLGATPTQSLHDVSVIAPPNAFGLVRDWEKAA